MYRSFLVLFCFTGVGFCQIKAPLTAPRVGLVRYADSTVRPVYGLPASFVVGKPVSPSVTAAAFSDSGGILVSGRRIRVITADGSTLAEETGSADGIVGI